MGRPKGSRNSNSLLPRKGEELVELKSFIKQDAPKRYLQACDMVDAALTAVGKARFENDEGNGKKLANCSIPEYMDLCQKAFSMTVRLMEHGIGKATESKEVTENKKLVIQLVGYAMEKFRLPAPVGLVEKVVETEAREVVGDASQTP